MRNDARGYDYGMIYWNKYWNRGFLLSGLLLQCIWTAVFIGDIGSVASAAEVVSQSRRFSIWPTQVELQGRHAVQHLVVSEEQEDAIFVDLTGRVEYHSMDPGIAVVSSAGKICPVANGVTEIVVRADQFESRVTVNVMGLDQEDPVDFRTEVIGALSRGGCSQGACHGSPQGKNGFRLSLRGFDPDLDITTLAREDFSRRVNQIQPDQSLLLLKASGRLPHQGGRRFRKEAPAYQMLQRWVAEGHRDSTSPRELQRLEVFPRLRRLATDSPRQQLNATAHYSDGCREDVTNLAVFFSPDESLASVSSDGLVKFDQTAEAVILVRFLDKIETARITYIQRDDAYVFQHPQEVNVIDEHIGRKQERLQLQPADVADDATFLRRVSLDLIGQIPEPEEAKEFLASSDPDKRRQMIERLLTREEYAQFWALKWADVMRGNRELISERGLHNFHRYLVRNFSSDRQFNQVAREILTSVGNTIDVPAANFYRVSQTPVAAAESFSQLFLGVRIQCAKCHNHPYESITQKDYYGLAAFFSRVRLKGVRFGIDDQTIFLADQGEVKMPGQEEPMAPVAFGLVQESNPAVKDFRRGLADWLTSPENKYFARSTVNRVWFHLMGQGLVEPIDDFRDSNPPSNPELLDALADAFVQSGFRFKPIMRLILNSRTYQLKAEPIQEQSPSAASPDRYFTHAMVKMLSAEQLIDAISMATGIEEVFPGYPPGTKAVALAEGNIDHKFLKSFTKPIRDVACDCAREFEPSLNQVVHLLNNPDVLDKIDSEQGRIARWILAGQPLDKTIQSIYLATLTRLPTAEEVDLITEYITKSGNETEGLRDVQHALINSNEFLLRH